MLCNESTREGIYPNLFNQANVVSIYKGKGSKHKVSGYLVPRDIGGTKGFKFWSNTLYNAYIWFANLTQIKCLIYVDDTKLVKTIKMMQDSGLLQDDLDKSHDWCKQWKVIININKCQLISFTNKTKIFLHNEFFENKVITSKTVVSDLGVWLCSNLSFEHHVTKVATSAWRHHQHLHYYFIKMFYHQKHLRVLCFCLEQNRKSVN